MREDLCQVMFEQLGATAVYVGSSAFFSVLGAGLSTALVLDIGEAGSYATAVDEGYPLAHSTASGGPGGKLLSEWMASAIQRATSVQASDVDWRLSGRMAKERLGYVASDFSEEMQKLQNGKLGPAASCELPSVGSFEATSGEGFRCAELLFCPSCPAATDPACCGVHELIISSLRMQSEINLRGKLLENVLLTGGSSMFSGLQERLLREVRLQSPWVAPGTKPDSIQVHAPPDRDVLSWKGAAALAECDVVRQLWISRKDYNGSGPGAIHWNFF
eukprot:gnl/TRDRNA2_/TRDRNA2_203633_c0_seq1.p1 gnl/TRDRNA2_/TRDRNA2_203633_c0~~gnl/TRDRNA2_/TRDRNA2_203633_c0_seq1.p1  ORF type:complete len:316 (-),score=47.72 gnl/TRDRNA2_/TRDRNA2_203633_c0_seq1:125-949(-)